MSATTTTTQHSNAALARAEALHRAESGTSIANYATILDGFAAKGILMSDVEPRVNVFTFNAWLAKGRCVRKGEHGVKITTWVPMSLKEHRAVTDDKRVTKLRPRTTTVFHVSQTEPVADRLQRGTLGRAVDEPADCYPDPGELAADRWNEGGGA